MGELKYCSSAVGAEGWVKGIGMSSKAVSPLFLCLKYIMNFIKIFIKMTRCSLFSKWLKESKASAAVEFSLLAIPYITLVLVTIEISLMFASATLLEGATGSASRLIRTGQIQQAVATGGGVNAEQMFRDQLCGYMTVLIDCTEVTVESIPMANYTDFGDVGIQFDADGDVVGQGFATGASNDKVLVRVSYRYSLMTPLAGQLLGGPDSSLLFVSTIVLQTEPYEAEFS